MKVYFLGTGTSTGVPEIGCSCEVCCSNNPKDNRLRASALIEIEGKHILIDCGPDFRIQMLRVLKQTSFQNIDGVLLTHEHYDHVGGLDDLRVFSHRQDVNIYAEKYVVDAIKDRIPYCFRENKYPGVPNLRMNTIDENTAFHVSGIQVIPIRLMHGKLPILGYRIGNMAYLTDMKTIEDKEYNKLKGLDVLIINALRTKEHISHQSLNEALEQIGKINPAKAYIIHMSHSFGLHEEVQKQLPHNVLIAYDGHSFNV
ncbi:MBL fold metallo-hydrolase [Bacteroidales bacterium OttesenSCG-928-M11]|nr:MBL fold metallo-hydrolase [Bacteroidales bacterium OttesenSCG-928-M11]